MTDANRRDFLKTSTAAAVGGSLLTGFAGQAGAFAGADETIRVGLVGCGGRGTGAASQALSTEGPVALVAMGDVFGDQLDNSEKRIKAALNKKSDRVQVADDHKFVGFDAYKKVIESDIDLVILATPPGFRPYHFEYAIENGRHVFMEKPVATDAAGVRKVLENVAKAKEKNRKVGVGLQRHHQYTYVETMKQLKDGAIGDIIATRVYWNGAGVWDPRRNREQVSTEMEYQMRNWYYYNWLCGDHICEQHIHNIDVSNWLKDAVPVKARACGGRQVRTDKKYGEIFDHFNVQFEYPDGTYMFSECRHQPATWRSVSEYALGAKGFANIGGASITAGDDSWKYKGPKNNPYQTEHDDLFAAIRNDLPYNEGEYGASSTMTAILGRMCAYSGKELTYEQALNSKIDVMPEAGADLTWESTPPTTPNDKGEYPIPTPGITQVV